MSDLLQWPLTWLTLTVGVYLVFARAHRALRKYTFAQVLLNPIAWAVAAVVALLQYSGVSYDVYFEGGKALHSLLGPCTVALGVPLYEQRARIKAAFVPLLLALVTGSITAMASAAFLARFYGAPTSLVRSFIAKSITTPIAIAVSERIGGIPSITTAVVLVTGVVGGVLLLPLLQLARIHNPEARGFALGLCAHGVGTARAFQVSNEVGAFAGVAVGLNGIFTALVVPFLLPWLSGP